MEIEEIKRKIRFDKYEITFHAEKERYAEDITISDLETAISQGEILEDYPCDPRGTSCLVLGYSQNRPIHNHLWLYTHKMDQNNNSIYSKIAEMDRRTNESQRR